MHSRESSPDSAISSAASAETEPRPAIAAGGSWRWLVVSGVLMVVYLGFFHLCLDASRDRCMLTGVVAWSLWFGICFCNRSVFRNRFEYFIHQLVGVDILLEGFSPLHQGYSFYSCALSFWTIFFAYHFLFRRPAPIAVSGLVEESADPGH